MANTLYPPQVNTFMPAFTGDSAVVYYSISPYNTSVSASTRVQVTVVDQVTNQNALADTSGVFRTQGEPDEVAGLCKIVIPASDMYDGKFKNNQFYKVQLRFDKSEKDSTLVDSREYCSEWSSVCLIRYISQPTLTIRNFETASPAFNKGTIPVVGHITFADSNESDSLESFRIQVTDTITNNTYIDTGNVFASGGINDINYNIDIAGLPVEAGERLNLTVTYTTKNQYVGSKTYTFQIVEYIEDPAFNPIIKAVECFSDATVKVSVKNPESVFGIIHIKRSSNHTHYREWETVYTKKVAGPIDMDIVDNTVCSTYWYRYSVQLENVKGALSPLYTTKKVIVDFHDAMISRGSRQFAVRFNYQISSFKPVVNRAKIDTLGGKYPKFAENAQMNYKQFNVTGLISAQADFTEIFLGKKDFFDDAELRTYDIYRRENDVIDDYDYLWEKEFREEAIKWLNDGKPKLYRSQTEGNMVVMITDVNLTPNKILSRRLWDFSAVIYEIGDGYDMATLDRLGIYDIHADGLGGDGSSWGDNSDRTEVGLETQSTIEKVGQQYFHNVINDSEHNFVTDVIQTEIQKRYDGIMTDKILSGFSIRNVKIFFHSKPHVYTVDSKGQLALAKFRSEAVENNQAFVYGYRIKINESDDYVFVNSDGYYQIPNDITVTSLQFPDCEDREEQVTIEYIVCYHETVNRDKVIRSMSVDKTIVGQLSGPFEPYDYLTNNISKKYEYASKNVFTRVDALNGICVDVQPQAVVKVRYTDDLEYHDYVVGMGGVLHLLDDGFTVKDFCFAGIMMNVADEGGTYFLENWECVPVNNYGRNIQYPVVNHVYYKDTSNKYQIFYRDHKWYDFTWIEPGVKGIAHVPVDGVVNYYCDVIRGEY